MTGKLGPECPAFEVINAGMMDVDSSPIACSVLLQSCCFLLHPLSSLESFFRCSLLTLCSLPIFVHLTTFQDSLHDLPCIYILEVVISDLMIYTQCFGTDVRIIRKGDE